MIGWLIALIGATSGAALALWFRGRAQKFEDQAALWREQAKRSAADLMTMAAAAREERGRLEEALRVEHEQGEAARRRLADLARGNPELAREYLRGVLEAAAGAAGADPHAPVPGHPAAPVPPGSGHGDR